MLFVSLFVIERPDDRSTIARSMMDKNGAIDAVTVPATTTSPTSFPTNGDEDTNNDNGNDKGDDDDRVRRIALLVATGVM
jgi:hypothetical protein